jgi:sec-independent protein translocase protein TatA
MFGGIGMWEVLLVFLVVLLLFGAKRLPEIGSSLGKGIREFKGSLREIESELKLPDEKRGASRPGVTPPRDSATSGHGDPGREGEPRKLFPSEREGETASREEVR